MGDGIHDALQRFRVGSDLLGGSRLRRECLLYAARKDSTHRQRQGEYAVFRYYVFHCRFDLILLESEFHAKSPGARQRIACDRGGAPVRIAGIKAFTFTPVAEIIDRHIESCLVDLHLSEQGCGQIVSDIHILKRKRTCIHEETVGCLRDIEIFRFCRILISRNIRFSV